MWSLTKKLGPIGSAVLTFIGYKQTNKEAKYVYRCKINVWKLRYTVVFGKRNPKNNKFWISFEKFYAGRWFKYAKMIEYLSNQLKKWKKIYFEGDL